VWFLLEVVYLVCAGEASPDERVRFERMIAKDRGGEQTLRDGGYHASGEERGSPLLQMPVEVTRDVLPAMTG